MSETNDEPTPVDQAHHDYNARIEAIRNDPRLSDEGRRAALEEAYEATRDTVNGLLTDARERTEARSRQLREQLFAVTGNISDARNAQDRVSAVKRPEQLGDLMEQAHVAGDKGLLHAAFVHAYEKSTEATASGHWRTLVEIYVQENPSMRGRLEELDRINGRDKSQRLLDRIAKSVLKPAELRTGPKPKKDDPLEDFRQATPTRSWG